MLKVDLDNKDYISVIDENDIEVLHIEYDYTMEEIRNEIIDLVGCSNASIKK